MKLVNCPLKIVYSQKPIKSKLVFEAKDEYEAAIIIHTIFRLNNYLLKADIPVGRQHTYSVQMYKDGKWVEYRSGDDWLWQDVEEEITFELKIR